MTELNSNRFSLTPEEFLETYVKLYHEVKDYQELLQVYKDADSDDPKIVAEALQLRVDRLRNEGINLKGMELIGAYIRFTLETFQGEALDFVLPPEPTDDFYDLDNGYESLQKDVEVVEAELRELENKVYYLTRFLPSQNADKLRLLLRSISGFMKSVVRKDYEDMESHINHMHHLSANRESYLLVNEIGHMLRDVYNSVQDFSSDVPTEQLDTTVMDEMPDAIDKLNLVIDRMENAANSTLDDVEGLLDINSEAQNDNQNMSESCAEVVTKLAQLKADCPGHEGLIEEITGILDNKVIKGLNDRTKRLKNSEAVYFRIIGAQSFQDITGQTLKKIIKFIEELELSLMNILKKYSGKLGQFPQGQGASAKPAGTAATEPTGSTDPLEVHTEDVSPLQGKMEDGLVLEGPADNKNDKSTNQADIDKMLAEFGF